MKVFSNAEGRLLLSFTFKLNLDLGRSYRYVISTVLIKVYLRGKKCRTPFFENIFSSWLYFQQYIRKARQYEKIFSCEISKKCAYAAISLEFNLHQYQLLCSFEIFISFNLFQVIKSNNSSKILKNWCTKNVNKVIPLSHYLSKR